MSRIASRAALHRSAIGQRPDLAGVCEARLASDAAANRTLVVYDVDRAVRLIVENTDNLACLVD
jgi:hypothetical protein